MLKDVAQKTYDAVVLDSIALLSPACIVDFGLDRGDLQGKFAALASITRRGATVEEFEEAMGSGIKLTVLVAKYGSEQSFGETSWDVITDKLQ